MSTFSKDAAQLEREVEEQRHHIESRIEEIKERLSPGQLVDELLNFTKDGGQQFAANLGQTISNNPLPAALLGISMVWLMSSQAPKLSTPHAQPLRPRGQEYPYATVFGGMRRVSHAPDDTGRWYSEWEDTDGNRFKAESNESGHRASEFIDEVGRKFSGFIDEAGHRVRDFQDDAGNRLDDTMGWASHSFHDAQHGVSQVVGKVTEQAQDLGGAVQHHVDRTARIASDLFTTQPLVAGALAFAAGAAVGAALPHTEQEDQVLGKIADQVKQQAASVASDVYEEGKARAAELYDEGKEGAAKVYGDLTTGEESGEQNDAGEGDDSQQTTSNV